jgi:DNA-binding transcriptional regulator YdaS (Cro superfamily)
MARPTARYKERLRQKRGARFRSRATERAIKAAGGVTELAAMLRLSPQSVSEWALVPPERCLKVEELTGVSRHELRPDIYGRAPT